MTSRNPSEGKRILMLSTDRQIDRRILLQADSLQEEGWQVKILAMPLDDAAYDMDPRIVRIGQGVQRETQVLALYRRLRRHLPMNGWLMRQLKALAWRFVINHERFYFNLFLPDGLRHCADVVVAHDLPMLAVARNLADKFHAHLVYDSHELYSEQEFSRTERTSWSKLEQRHIHACDLVITVNPSIAQELKKRYHLNQVAVIHNAEHIHRTSTRSRYLHTHFNISHDQYVLLFQGGFSANRHLVELVSAMALLRTLPIHLVLLGDGQIKKRLQRLIHLKQLQHRVHLHPAVTQSDLLKITASADAGIIPYQATCLNNYYCTPNKLFEFIAAGIPILASDLPELRRLVHGNKIGRVADLATVNQIAAAIQDFFASGQLLHWRETVLSTQQKLNWSHEAKKLKQIYAKLK